MASGSPEAWYFALGLTGRQPVQFGPFSSEVECLAAMAFMQPIITSIKPTEVCFYHWRGTDLWKV